MVSSEGTLPESVPRVCPVYFWRNLGFGAYVLGTVIQLLGLGIGLDWREYLLYKVPTGYSLY